MTILSISKLYSLLYTIFHWLIISILDTFQEVNHLGKKKVTKQQSDDDEED